jgi:hypothetical protein
MWCKAVWAPLYHPNGSFSLGRYIQSTRNWRWFVKNRLKQELAECQNAYHRWTLHTLSQVENMNFHMDWHPWILSCKATKKNSMMTNRDTKRVFLWNESQAIVMNKVMNLDFLFTLVPPHSGRGNMDWGCLGRMWWHQLALKKQMIDKIFPLCGVVLILFIT